MSWTPEDQKALDQLQARREACVTPVLRLVQRMDPGADADSATRYAEDLVGNAEELAAALAPFVPPAPVGAAELRTALADVLELYVPRTAACAVAIAARKAVGYPTTDARVRSLAPEGTDTGRAVPAAPVPDHEDLCVELRAWAGMYFPPGNAGAANTVEAVCAALGHSADAAASVDDGLADATPEAQNAIDGWRKMQLPTTPSPFLRDPSSPLRMKP